MEKKRVVAYIRVSSKSSAQIHSYEFQEKYWKDKLESSSEYTLVGIYADRGISGCSVQKRPDFLRMIEDARKGCFDVIQTKSVSRFARNTVQLLQAVRELRDLGIEVIFENEQISTKQPSSELFLTIAATIAENDLAVDSERQRWSIQHRFENGWYTLGSGMYGYRIGSSGKVEIVPEEAETVRRIFDMYLSGHGCPAIAKALNREGVPNRSGVPWRAGSILKALSNEKYMGDAMMGKSVRIDGKKCDNLGGQHGERYYVENAHEGIVGREVFQQAQELRAQRVNEKLVKKQVPTYPLSGMVECGQCHANYRHKVNNSGTKWRSDIWMCGKQSDHGMSRCDCTRIKDEVLREKFMEAYNEFVTQRPQGTAAESIQQEIRLLQRQEQEIATLMVNNLYPRQTFQIEQKAIKAQIRKLQAKLRELQQDVPDSEFTVMTEFDEAKLPIFLRRIIITKNHVTFRFYNGVEISREYTNGQPGNKPGWNHKEV